VSSGDNKLAEETPDQFDLPETRLRQNIIAFSIAHDLD